jgi:proton-translocating NADH-quinone oxidoreductase chain M
MLLGILCIYSYTGSTDYYILINTDFSESRQLFLWLSFFASFAVKIPMFPLHIWLPQAHVEAPTAGSVLLAGILLKLGGYGFLRFSIPMFPYASRFFVPLIFTLSILAIIYASLTTIRQIDLKRIIAYSSVAHMNYVTLGIFSFNIQGVEGSILLMLSHGLVSSALFLIVGMLYDRFKTRIIRYFSGLTQLMPLFSIFFLFLTFSNISFPGTSGFVGEMLILMGIFNDNIFTVILATMGTILGAVYSIWLYNRIFFGQLDFSFIKRYSDLNRREFFILIPFVVLTLIMGIYPSAFLNVMHISITNLLMFYY